MSSGINFHSSSSEFSEKSLSSIEALLESESDPSHLFFMSEERMQYTPEQIPRFREFLKLFRYQNRQRRCDASTSGIHNGYAIRNRLAFSEIQVF